MAELTMRAVRVHRYGGTLVSVVAAPPAGLAEELGVRAVSSAAIPSTAQLRSVLKLIEAGQVRPVVRASFPLHAAGRAHELAQSGHGRGRVVVEIGAGDAAGPAPLTSR